MNNETLLKAVRARFSSRWDFYAAVFLCAWTLLIVPSWPRLPYFMDAYYHLSVMRGFCDAGGWVGHAFWEAAPVGRAHLYPPLFHFIGCAFLGSGVPALVVARLLEFFVYPLFLLVLWRGARRLASDRAAFFFLLLLAGSSPLYVYVINNVPFSLAMLIGFGAHLFYRQGRWKTAGLLIAAAFYTHTLMAVVTTAAFLLAGALDGRKGLGRAVASVVLGGVLASPLLVYQAVFSPYFVYRRTLEYYNAQVNIALCLLVLLGVRSLFRRRREARYFLVLYAMMAVLWMTNRDRFLSGQGAVPLCFFAALVLDEARERGRPRGRVRRVVFWAAVAGLFLAATPILTLSASGSAPHIELSSALRDLGGVEGVRNIKGKSLYHPRFVRQLAEQVGYLTQPNDLLFSNYAYAGGMVAVLAHRATSTAMLKEVRPWVVFDPVRAAQWVIWFKDPGDRTGTGWERIGRRYNLVPVLETDLAWVLHNPAAREGRRIVPAVWGWPFILFCLFSGFGVYLWERVHGRRESEK